MPEPVAPWQEAFRVRAYEVDPSGRASIQTLCNYLQEAAGNHARALGLSVEQLLEQNLTWVLARLHVEVTRYPRWRDTIEVETWPSGLEGLYATREFVARGEGAAPILKASSAWLLVDVNRKRPVRMPDFVTELVAPRRERPMADPFPQLPRVDMPHHEQRFHVRYSDLDVNRHVNNVRYVEWAVETLPQPLIENHHLSSLEVTFRTETAYGEIVLGQAQQTADAPLSFIHRVLREADGSEAAVVRTVWQAG